MEESDEKVLEIVGELLKRRMELDNQYRYALREEMHRQYMNGAAPVEKMHPALFDQLAEAAPAREMQVLPNGDIVYYNPKGVEHLRQARHHPEVRAAEYGPVTHMHPALYDALVSLSEAEEILERARQEGVFFPNEGGPNRAQRRAAKRRKP